MSEASLFGADTTHPVAITVDRFVGGRIEAVQTASGHRSGLEAVLLAASVDRLAAGTVIELGAGTGICGLAVAAFCKAASVVLVERDAAALGCLRRSLQRPANRAFVDRIALVEADIGWSEADRAAAGLHRERAEIVLANPPFHEAFEVRASPDQARMAAHILGNEGLDGWLRTAVSLLKPDGCLTVIHRADRLDKLLVGLARRFGSVDVLPIHPRADRPAHRVLVRAVKGSRAGLNLLPPLVLHGLTGNAFLPPVEAVLRQGAGLSEVHPPWQALRSRPS